MIRSTAFLLSASLLTGLSGCYVEGQGQARTSANVSGAYVQGGSSPYVGADPSAAQAGYVAPQSVAVSGAAQVTIDADDANPEILDASRDELSSYGTWWEDNSFGQVWTPHTQVVGNGFTPYVSSGHWTYANNEYVWVSDYDWGWLPFHYGRWAFVGGRGWSWVPGRRYSGGWVDWRTGENGVDYVGWGPTAPNYYWRGGVAYPMQSVNYTTPYVFCPSREIFSTNVATVLVAGPQVATIGPRTRPYYAPGNVGIVGPPPVMFGFNDTTIVRPPSSHVGMWRATQYARPGVRVPVYRPSTTIGTLDYSMPGQYARPMPQSTYVQPAPGPVMRQGYVQPQTQVYGPSYQQRPYVAPQYARPVPRVEPSPAVQQQAPQPRAYNPPTYQPSRSVAPVITPSPVAPRQYARPMAPMAPSPGPRQYARPMPR